MNEYTPKYVAVIVAHHDDDELIYNVKREFLVVTILMRGVRNEQR